MIYHNGKKDGRWWENQVDIRPIKFKNIRSEDAAPSVMVSECYQCYRSTNGCPVADVMDITPHGIIGCIIRGHREKALSSGSIWTCVQCLTCGSRCPNGIKFARAFEALLKLSPTSGLKSGKQVRRFEKLFIESVVSHCRFYELGVILRYRLYKNEFREDVFMGLDMLKKGRIGIFPHNIRNKNP